MASEIGRGAQVRLDDTARALARGGNTSRLIDNVRLKLAAEIAGTAPSGNTPDGSLGNGVAADDEVLLPGGAAAAFSYIAPGAGAVTRTALDKARESISILDFGADNTGVNSITPNLIQAMATGKPIFFPPGTYKMATSAVVPSGTVLWAHRGTATIIAAANAGLPLLNISAVTRVLVDGLSFDGNHPAVGSAGTITQVYMSSYVVFSRCHWQNCWGIAVLFSTSNTYCGVRDSTLRDCGNHWIVTNDLADAMMGICFCCGVPANSFGNFATGNDLWHIGLDGIGVYGQSRCTIANNRMPEINNCPIGIGSGGIGVSESDDIIVTGNLVIGSSGNGIDVGGMSDATISNNFVSESGGAGISIATGPGQLCRNVTVSGNVCKDNTRTPTFAQRGGITLVAYGGVTSTMSRVSLVGNVCSDSQTVKTQSYGLYVYGPLLLDEVWIDPSNLFTGNLTANFGAQFAGLMPGFSSLKTARLLVQSGTATPMRLTTDGVAASAVNVCALPNNSMIAGRLIVSAYQIFATAGAVGDTATWLVDLQMSRGANAAATTLDGGTVLVAGGTLSTTLTAMPPSFAKGALTGARLAVTADTTNGGINVTGTGQTGKSLNWVARFQMAEVALA